MATITYRAPKKGVNTRLNVKNDGAAAVLSDPKSGKIVASMKIDQPAIIMNAVKQVIKGDVLPITIKANGIVSRHRLGLVQFDKFDWRPVCVCDDGGVGSGAPDDDDDNNGSGGVTAMMDPVTAGVIIVGIITAGAVAWHAIDEGATFELEVGKDGVKASVDANGPDQLPDNGDNPQLPGD
ncbi:MAG: hypothetical protein AAFR39_13225 [Pseudomonadota bacterium]